MRLIYLVVVLLAGSFLTVHAQEATPEPVTDEILFISDRDGGFEIYTLSLEDETLNRLTETPDRDEFTPQWSPDNTQIAFTVVEENNPDVYIMNADGSDVRRLTDDEGFDELLSWTPDGNLLMASAREGDENLYLLNPETGDLVALSEAEAGEGQLVFTSDDAGNADIFLLDRATGEITNLTNAPGNQGSPVLSPDGKTLLYVMSRGSNTDIYSMDLETGESIQLTDGPGFDHAASWSADGEQILFMSDRDGNNEVYSMNADGSDQHNVSNHPANDGSPDLPN